MKRLYRSKDDVKIYGICAGIAKIFNLDPTIVRIGMVILTFVAGIFPVITGYIIGMFIIPEEGDLS
ncbi:MAG: PspC domain-containing protein [Chitinispirillales bacterium]|jgi:phage shock protein C|nr:PspC domain-containing protein [Chitinispirillales bacterium]